MKFFLYILVALSLLQVARASKITDMIEKQSGQKVTFIKEENLSQDSNLKVVTLKDNESGLRILVLANKAESMILAVNNAFFTSNDGDRDLVLGEFDSMQNYNMTYKTQAKVKQIISKLPKDYIIDLKGKGKGGKKTFYIVSDPMCPHCQHEMANIDSRLARGDVKLIIVGWMTPESADKAADIFKQIKNLKTDEEKIALLKKVYDTKYKAPSASKDDKKKLQEVVTQLMGKGKVEGTPYIIEE